jgi:hypothetical protein
MHEAICAQPFSRSLLMVYSEPIALYWHNDK